LTPIWAQFSELQATVNGGQLYFTSTLQFAGSPPGAGQPRIYRIAETGLELFEDASSSGAQVSADGRTVGFVKDSVAQLRGLRAQALGPGSLAMSRSAQWAVLTQSAGPPPVNAPPQSVLINLDTGERTALPEAVGATFPVASDGTVVLQGANGPGLWKAGQFTPLTLRGPFGIYAISDDARILIYSQFVTNTANPEQRLVARDLTTGMETVFFSRLATPGQVAPMGFSSDGRLVLYRVTRGGNAGSAFLADTTTGDSTAIALPNDQLVTDGTLAGWANMSFLVTAAGGMVSVDFANGGAVQTLIPPTAFVSDFPVIVPGSLLRLPGAVPQSIPAVSMNGVVAPVRFATATELDVQAPWELQGSTQAVFRLTTSGSPFEQNQTVTVRGMFPRFEPLGPGESSVLGFKAVRGDFSGLLTSNPHPGDVIVLYMTGLGPVSEAVPTGQPAPVDHAVPITGQFTCTFDPYGSAETLFAGLAPGAVGIYQVNVRLPAGPDRGAITGGLCTYAGGGVNGGFTWTAASPSLGAAQN
jgi:uncharacterized protein (TIGR03437 family)